MAFDTQTRRRLNTFVGEARHLIAREFTENFQSLYGISPDGGITDLKALGHLDEPQLGIAALLRERIDYLVRSQPDDKGGVATAIARVAREQAFTVLNRLAALRMAEKRGLIVESVGGGYKSKGFQVYERVAGSALGETFLRYRRYLFCLFDELAVDLGALFDRRYPQGILFPREPALMALLELLNAPDLEELWGEDETLGWIYQYYNDETERKKMREESSAPRNSRELAVRNQFFTPRYVVEFLTDNTLGRIWYEMTQGATTLKEQCRYLVRRPNEIFLQPGESAPEQPKQDNLSQEVLIKQPVHIPHRPLKDPRSILMLDPACGSMHFGLYAFDLFEVIYDEAWALEEKLGADALSRPPGMKSLHDTYAGKDAFLKDVPRLIIEHNLHGIDIDPRCAQIAGLSLWLRAQKAWQRLGLKPAERPAIKRSNIVCAEPMPGEKELLREFVEREFPAAERAVCLQLLEAIFDKMQLAGEAGSLLKIEEEIRSAIEDARDAWQKLATKPPELFTTTELHQLSTAPELTGLEQAVSSLTTDFWERIEERIYAALRDYAEQAENGGGFQRRLFAEDAARGFAFIDVCRKRYDVALMNPPFGDITPRCRAFLEGCYEKEKHELAIAFVTRGVGLLAHAGVCGAITTRTPLFISSSAKWRETTVYGDNGISAMADLGHGVLDAAMVETAAYVVQRNFGARTAIVFRVLKDEMKEAAISGKIRALDYGSEVSECFVVNQASLSCIDDWPFCYWVPPFVLHLFAQNHLFEAETRFVRQGGGTADDFRFTRLRWEVAAKELTQSKWVPISQGEDATPFTADISLCVKWDQGGAELKDYLAEYRRSKGWSPHWAAVMNGYEYYFKPGLRFWRRSNRFTVAPLPAGVIFTKAHQAIFSTDGSEMELIGLTNSPLFNYLIVSQRGGSDGGLQFEVGLVKRTPVPRNSQQVKDLAMACWELGSRLMILEETHSLFVFNGKLASVSIADLSAGESAFALKNIGQINENADAIHKSVLGAYGVSIEQFASLEDAFRFSVSSFIDKEFSSPSSVVARIVMWLIGASFGRWDIRYATGEQAAPELPDPFAPLPVCPPGQLQNAQGLPLGKDEVGKMKEEGIWNYPIEIPWDGILVDDPNHPLDLERRVREVIEIIWSGQEGGPTAEAIEHEACEILGVKSLRDYFRKPAGFFADHLKRYSKSRRQAPIYWPLSTPSGSYTLWIYFHRLTDQTLHTAIADFIDPKLKSIDHEISAQREKSSGGGTKLAELLEFRGELLDLKAELERIIKLPWKPNLNDGVLITGCPLWKLFRLPKWQKDLKTCWQELDKGDYDWAHLAYSIWPKRVEEACKTDRSIAIAHGLEHLCQVAPPKPKKERKTKQAEPETNDGLLEGFQEPTSAAKETAPAPAVAPVAVGKSATKQLPLAADGENRIDIENTDRDEVMCRIRQLFGKGGPREREAALKELSMSLGYQRLGTKVREILERDLLTAVRRGILANESGQLRLAADSVDQVSRDELKDEFLAAIGRAWIDREDAMRSFARFLGYARTGPVLEETSRSLINRLIREGRLEANGPQVRRT